MQNQGKYFWCIAYNNGQSFARSLSASRCSFRLSREAIVLSERSPIRRDETAVSPLAASTHASNCELK